MGYPSAVRPIVPFELKMKFQVKRWGNCHLFIPHNFAVALTSQEGHLRKSVMLGAKCLVCFLLFLTYLERSSGTHCSCLVR